MNIKLAVFEQFSLFIKIVFTKTFFSVQIRYSPVNFPQFALCSHEIFYDNPLLNPGELWSATTLNSLKTNISAREILKKNVIVEWPRMYIYIYIYIYIYWCVCVFGGGELLMCLMSTLTMVEYRVFPKLICNKNRSVEWNNKRNDTNTSDYFLRQWSVIGVIWVKETNDGNL